MLIDLSMRAACTAAVVVTVTLGFTAPRAEDDPQQDHAPPGSASPMTRSEVQADGEGACWAVASAGSNSGELGGTIVGSESCGDEWFPVFTTERAPLSAVTFAEKTYGWAVGPGMILHTNTGGRSWSAQREAKVEDEVLQDVAFGDRHHGVTVGAEMIPGPPVIVREDGATGDPPVELGLPPAFVAASLVLHTSDGGKTWERAAIPREAAKSGALRSVCLADAGQGLAVGYRELASGEPASIVLVTTDAGKTWRDVSDRLPRPGVDRAVCGGASDLWLVGSGLVLLRSSDRGRTWTDRSDQIASAMAVSGQLADVTFLDRATGWAAGANPDPVVAVTLDGGASWQTQRIEGLTRAGGLTSIAFAPGGRLGITVGFRGDGAGRLAGVGFVTRDGGANWQPVRLPASVRALGDATAIGR
jgi:photosystem II stability/assembly factor-like uncharacterized protein